MPSVRRTHLHETEMEVEQTNLGLFCKWKAGSSCRARHSTGRSWAKSSQHSLLQRHSGPAGSASSSGIAEGTGTSAIWLTLSWTHLFPGESSEPAPRCTPPGGCSAVWKPLHKESAAVVAAALVAGRAEWRGWGYVYERRWSAFTQEWRCVSWTTSGFQYKQEVGGDIQTLLCTRQEKLMQQVTIIRRFQFKTSHSRVWVPAQWIILSDRLRASGLMQDGARYNL